MAETIHIRGEGGGIHPMDLPLHESVQQRLAKGQLVRVNPDGSPYTGLAQPAVASPPPVRPGKAAAKAEWVGWAVTVHRLTPDEAEARTKQDLMDLPDQPAVPDPNAAGRPADDAPKSEWIDYVVKSGRISREDAEAYTKDDLIDMVS